jgi:hypothetical protein
MVKNDGRLIKKLESRYRGPFTVVGVTDNMNYILTDVLNKKLDLSVPLHKLKQVEVDDLKNDFAEIEKIISHKLIDNKPMYLVKWLNLDSKDNSWVRPEDFASMKFVNDYLRSLPQGRTTRSRKIIAGMNVLLNLFVIILFLPVVFSFNSKEVNINDNFDFDFCPITNDMVPINLNDICFNPTELGAAPVIAWFEKYYSKGSIIPIIPLNRSTAIPSASTEIPKFKRMVDSNVTKTFKESQFKAELSSKPTVMYNFQAQILSKSINTVSGQAFQCKRIIFTRTWTENFFGSKYRNDEVKTEKLDSNTCWYMIKSKKCEFGNFKNEMSCDDNNNCNYEGFPSDAYSWLRDVTMSFAHCYISPRLIAEADLTSHIFNGICKVSDWYCNLKDTIIVWSKDVIHTCGFKRVALGYLTSTNGVQFFERGLRLGFQYKRIETNCGVDMIVTTEGLYLAPLATQLAGIENYDDFKDTRGTVDLLLADSDFKALEILENDSLLLLKECIQFVNTMKLFTENHDRFMRIKDFKKNDVIIYTANGQIYAPTCSKISNITVASLAACYEDIPAYFRFKEKNYRGFLTRDRVLRISSTPVECSKFPKYIPLPFLNKTIVSYDKTIELIDTFKLNFKKFNFFDTKFHIDLSHTDTIIQGFDILSQLHNLSYITENGEGWMVIPGKDSINDSAGNLKNLTNYIKNYFWHIFAFVLGTIVLSAVIFVFIKISLWCIRFYLKRRSNRPIPRSTGIYSDIIQMRNLSPGTDRNENPYNDPIDYDIDNLSNSNLTITEPTARPLIEDTVSPGTSNVNRSTGKTLNPKLTHSIIDTSVDTLNLRIN